jgi:ketosteroid isomerase-like protein
MAEDTPTAIHDLVRRTFATLQAKDLETLMQMFADHAVVIEPHFPTPRMQGKASIRKGFGEAMSGMRSFGYTIANYFESENGQGAAVETATTISSNKEWSETFLKSSSLKRPMSISRGCKHTNRMDHMGP